MRKTLVRWIVLPCLVLIGVSLVGLGVLYAALSASLPVLDGERVIGGLSEEVAVDRDALGIAVITSSTYEDAVCAQGYVQAQERYFQMDLSRRYASGRLAEVLGEARADLDERQRRLGLERVAGAFLSSMPSEQRAWLESYARGVNAGLADLGGSPPEYLALRVSPAPWRASDSVLCAIAMHQNLAFGETSERMIDVMRATLPADLAGFLTPRFTAWDTPLFPDETRELAPLPIGTFGNAEVAMAESSVAFAAELGSNGWAVGGRKTADGRAIVANDMHLGLMVPNTWHRIELRTEGRVIAGVSLPGVPGIVVGSSGRVAWGFTNSMGDYQDLVRVRQVEGDPERYRTPDGSESFESRTETIVVKGGDDRVITVRETVWGPLVEPLHDGTDVALAWPVLRVETFNMRVLDLWRADDVRDALEIVSGWYGPPQNCMLADDAGSIAWTISGYLPLREGFDGTQPADWADEGIEWVDGAQFERPSIVNPPSGFIATANGRTVGASRSMAHGSNWGNAVRQKRITDVLSSSDDVREIDMLNLQLDTDVTALFSSYLEAALIASDTIGGDRGARARGLLEAWNGKADLDQPGMTVLNAFRRELHKRVIDHLVAPCREADDSFRYTWFQSDEVIRRIIVDRPVNLLPGGASSWDEVFAGSLTAALDSIRFDRRDDASLSWSEFQVAEIRHPISMAVPALGFVLDAPRDGLPGHTRAVRAQGASFGASERLVVSPSRERDAILHMPTGQTLHPLSAHFMDMHGAWVRGDATPLLAGEARSTLRLVPAE